MIIKKFFVLLVLLVLLSNVAFAFPSIIYRNGVNITRAKEMLSTINDVMLDKVDVIEFTNSEGYYKGEYIQGLYKFSYYGEEDDIRQTFNKRIIIYESDLLDDLETECILLHEFGHRYYFDTYKVIVEHEDYANEFAYEHNEECEEIF